MNSRSTRNRATICVMVVTSTLALTLVACRRDAIEATTTPQADSSWRELFDDGEADVGHFVMGFAPDDIPTAHEVGIRTYSVAASEPITMTYHGLSSLPDPVHLRVTLLVDFEQVPFILDGEEAVLHDVVLETQEIRDVPIVIPPLSEGAHDILWLPFLNPDDHSSDQEFRESWTYSNVDRFTLLAGGERDWETREVESLSAFEAPEEFAANYPWRAFFTDQPEVLAQWFEEEVTPGELLNYYVFTGYEPRMSPTDDRVNTFAILVFLDYELVPLVAGDDRLVRFFSIDAERSGARIEASLVASQTGPHELCVLRVDNVAQAVDTLVCEECSPGAIFPFLDHRTLVSVR